MNDFGAPEGALPADTLARLERIKELARKNRQNYAVQKQTQPRKTARPAKTKARPSKAQKPYFYNPAQRD